MIFDDMIGKSKLDIKASLFHAFKFFLPKFFFGALREDISHIKIRIIFQENIHPYKFTMFKKNTHLH